MDDRERDERVRRSMGYPARQPLLDAHEARERERRAEIGRQHGLSADEVEAAERYQMRPEKYAALKGVYRVDAWHAANRRLAEQDAVRAEAARQLAVDAEKARLAAEAAS